MAIVNSVIVEDAAQVSGIRYVTEQHTDHLGVVWLVRYVALAGTDITAVMTARIARLEARLAEAEMARNLGFIFAGEFAQVTTHYITLADAQAAIRAAYQVATGEQVGRLAAFLLTLSDARLRALFSLTQSQVASLRSRLQTKVDALAAVQSATGE